MFAITDIENPFPAKRDMPDGDLDFSPAGAYDVLFISDSEDDSSFLIADNKGIFAWVTPGNCKLYIPLEKR